MTAPTPDVQSIDALEAEADKAASLGDLAFAQTRLLEVVEASPGRIDTWLKLAAIRRASGNLDGAQAAITGALKVDPLHFVALLSRARLFESAGDAQEAARAYLRALAQIDDDQTVPAGLVKMVEHGRRLAEAHQDRVAEAWLRAADADPALSDDERAALTRFTSNALRRTRVYHSEPTDYHYPGLSEREFHDCAAFDWLTRLEAATPAIRDEYLALATGGRAEPYIRMAEDTPVRQWSALNQSLDWTAFHLLAGGRSVAENAERCPATMAILGGIEQPRIAGRSPNAMFSLLKPHTRIPPHTGVANTRLVCHLPLIVPEGCWFRVGETRREWRPGEAFVFDDTIEHEAANDSAEPRVVLIFDVWHPGLSPRERAAAARVMEADEASHGAPL